MTDNELDIKEPEVFTDAPTEEEKFLKTLKDVRIGYICTLVVTAIILIGAIASAVLYKVSLGLLLIILAIVTYTAIVTNLLYKNLGISYRALHGCLTVRALYGKGREVVYIPKRIILLTVTEIGMRAFTHESSKSIREIHLPKTLLRIGASAFAKLPALTDVYYEGTEEEWNAISALAPLENVTMHFCEPIPELIKPKKEKKSKKEKKEKKA
ncbi:MAG: hypothetical protein J6U68_04400 [Clostridia bacterium]|nr:hypothetical protein [Clostridia bacterium]